MTSLFDDASKNAEKSLETWKAVINFLQTAEGPGGERFNQEEAVPGTEYELWWFDERVISVCGLIAGLSKTESDWGAPIPEENVSSLQLTSSNLLSTLTEIRGIVDQVSEKGIDSLNPANWVIVIKGTGQETNLASHLQKLRKQLENQLKQYLAIAAVITSAGFSGFNEAVRDFAELAETIRQHAKDAEDSSKAAKTESDNTAALKEKAEQDQEAVSEALKKANETLQTTESVNTQANDKLTAVTAISNKAEELKKNVDEYLAKFEAFQKSLDEKNEAFGTWTKDVEALYGRLSQKDKDIESTIQRAEDMLEGATNAGLAGSFRTKLDDLNGRLKWAQWTFYVSIVILIISSLPLAGYVLMTTLNTIAPETSVTAAVDQATGIWGAITTAVVTGKISLSATLALFLLMIPPVWLTKFSAANYNELFRLREHYQHKFSLAMAVDGFKKQAPDYENEIAYATFERLLFNPGDSIGDKSSVDAHPSPIMNKLMNKLGLNADGKEE